MTTKKTKSKHTANHAWRTNPTPAQINKARRGALIRARKLAMDSTTPLKEKLEQGG